MAERVTAAVAFLVWIDHAELLQRTPQLADDLTDQPHYAADLVYADQPSGGPACDISFASLDDALAWARASANEIIVRPSWERSVHYTATVSPPDAWPRRD